MARDPGDLIDRETGLVRVFARRCQTCPFRKPDPLHLRPGKLDALVEANVGAGALLTCHETLSYGQHPEVGPTGCAGFWARHGHRTAAGRLARLIGLIRPLPPRGGDGDAR